MTDFFGVTERPEGRGPPSPGGGVGPGHAEGAPRPGVACTEKNWDVLLSVFSQKFEGKQVQTKFVTYAFAPKNHS